MLVFCLHPNMHVLPCMTSTLTSTLTVVGKLLSIHLYPSNLVFPLGYTLGVLCYMSLHRGA